MKQRKDESKFQTIADEIKRCLVENGYIPTQRELSSKVGLGKTAVYRYLKTMKEKGLVNGSGRNIQTKETQLVPIPIVDCLFDNRQTYNNARINDFLLISRKIYGDGEFGLIRAIDDSMSKGKINTNDFIVIRRQLEANEGQIVLVKSKDRFYLRRLFFDSKKRTNRLTSESDTHYDEIIQYEIRGVAITILTHLDEDYIKRYLQYLCNN